MKIHSTTYDKDYWANKKPNGFHWYCFDKKTGLHHFSRRESKSGLYDGLKCSNKDVESGDLEFMAENGLTR